MGAGSPEGLRGVRGEPPSAQSAGPSGWMGRSRRRLPVQRHRLAGTVALYSAGRQGRRAPSVRAEGSSPERNGRRTRAAPAARSRAGTDGVDPPIARRSVAAPRLGQFAGLGRENDVAEEKVASDRFARGDEHHEELNTYARQCGQVLARLHCRHNAPAMFDTAWNAAEAARAALAFAEKYAAQVDADQKVFVQSKSQVAKALGL